MTATYDPADPAYFDPDDLVSEMDRVFDACHGCRLCFNLCPSFPTLFDFIDELDGNAAGLSEAQRHQVVDECYQCKLCYVKCPYVPPHEWKLDFPRLMLRVQAQRQRQGKSTQERLADQFLGHTDLLGTASAWAAPLVNALTGRPGSWPRKAMEKVVGVASERVLPPYAKQRFSSWFHRRQVPPAPPAPRVPDPAQVPSAADHHAAMARGTARPSVRAVAVFPTCFVEYMDPAIGHDVVRVLEHNGVQCTLPEGVACCGAPWLHSGNVERFSRQARKNVKVLARQVKEGRTVVVPQPTCAYVVRKDYPLYVSGAEAEAVARNTMDPAEYLVSMHQDGELAVDFPGTGVAESTVSYHVPCHLQAEGIGLKSRELLELAGIHCDLVQRCSGIDGTWGYRRDHYELARKVAQPLVRELGDLGNQTACGECHLANYAVLQETGSRPLHPIQLVARAYGSEEETP